MEGNAPIFIKINEYKDVIDTIDLIKTKIEEAKKNLEKIKDLKDKEDTEMDSWASTLDDADQKINEIDKALFEPEAL